MSSEFAGSCLCGVVRFQVEGEFDRFYLCHCSRCRKGTGSAHAANLFSGNARLRWLSGEDSTTTYQVPGTRHARSFCRYCGAAVPYAAGSFLLVPAGSLDTAISKVPDGHIFCASRATWDVNLGRLPEYDGFPAL